ncbi:MAG: rod shape-determining protein MreC [Sideroxydans sp.]|nr:rod shape-determining protein MreC [Sideroxydans sp.]
MEHTESVRFFNRGPSPAARLVFFSLLSLLLLFIDARYKYLESTRSAISTLVYPVQRLATLPVTLWREAGEFFVTQNGLIHDNEQLREQHVLDAARLQQLQMLQAENGQLRKLLDVQQRSDYRMQLAEIVYVERDVFQRKLFVDKGSQANVLPGQIVMDDNGIIGQVTRVYPWLSEITLVTDKDHAVPVQIVRNGLRAIVFGSGDTGDLSLRYMPVNSDIQNDDELVTSGIDGTYPPGIPVARVNHIERDPAYPFARILCTPIAGVNNQRFLLILSGERKLPPRPESATEDSKGLGKKGKRKMLP